MYVYNTAVTNQLPWLQAAILDLFEGFKAAHFALFIFDIYTIGPLKYSF